MKLLIYDDSTVGGGVLVRTFGDLNSGGAEPNTMITLRCSFPKITIALL